MFTWADGSIYDGQWSKSKKSGQGKMTWLSGEQYSGGWKDGQKEGYGVYTWRG